MAVKAKKIIINDKAIANSDDRIVDEDFVVEDERVGKRLGKTLTISAYSIMKPPGYALTLDIDYGTRVIHYDIKSYSSVKIDHENGTLEFTSSGIRYKIRGLEDSDKSWLQGTEVAKTAEES